MKFEIFQICQPCQVDYSAILKLETLNRDAEWFFQQANLMAYLSDWRAVVGEQGSAAHAGPGGREAQPGSSRMSVQSYFANITKDKIVDLYRKYKLDFDLFGYDVDEYL